MVMMDFPAGMDTPRLGHLIWLGGCLLMPETKTPPYSVAFRSEAVQLLRSSGGRSSCSRMNSGCCSGPGHCPTSTSIWFALLRGNRRSASGRRQALFSRPWLGLPATLTAAFMSRPREYRPDG